MYGYAHVEWSESHTVQRDGKSHTEYTTYSSNETYFKNYETVAGSRSGSEEVLRPGSHVYHARYILPQNLPENHENQYGHIRYEVKAHIDVPWGFDEKERVAFYVNPRRDLNAFRHLAEPVREEESQTFGCCCW
ncbi:Arrestin domain-containing protein 17, partial [Pseudolycoriella hygida]